MQQGTFFQYSQGQHYPPGGNGGVYGSANPHQSDDFENNEQNQPLYPRQLRNNIQYGEGCKTVLRPKHFNEWGIYYNDENKLEVMAFIDKFEGFMRCQHANEYQHRWYFEQVINSSEALRWKMSISSTIKGYISYRNSFVKAMWSSIQQDNAKAHFLSLKMDAYSSSVELASELLRWFNILADSDLPDVVLTSTILTHLPSRLQVYSNLSESCYIENRHKFAERLYKLTLREVGMLKSPYK